MMRQKLGDSIDGMAGNAAEDIFKPSEWINSSTLAGSDKAAQHGSRSTADIAAEKQPVAAADCDRASILPISVRKLMSTIVGTPLYGRRLRVQHSEQRASGRFIHVEVAPGTVTI